MSQLLSEGLLSSIKGIIGTYVGDISLGGVSITYKMSGSTVSTWSPTTQLIPDMYTSFSGVSAFKGSYDSKEVEDAEGMVEVGDEKFIIMVNAVTGVLSTGDKIYIAGTTEQSATTYEVKYFTRSVDDICYFIAGRAM